MIRQMPKVGPIVAVLDDESEMRKALRRLLQMRGYQVLEYASGEDFLHDVGTVEMDYLLLDLHMPGASGFDVLEALWSKEAPLAIIVVTAHDEPGVEEKVRGLGACAYLKKPVDRGALFEAIAEAT
jgi:FixJ family two-component response regulator